MMNPFMDSPSYFTLEISQIPLSLEDQLTFDLFEMAASGVMENLKFKQLDRRYQPEIISSDFIALTAFFETRPNTEEISSLINKYSDLKFSVNEHPIEDWLSEWKKSWKPFEVIPGYWIVPDWEMQSFDRTDKKVIAIEPGMAFGTGTHETTQIASLLMFNLFQTKTFKTVLDVGTGSGLLAFLAQAMGVEKVYAYDNDPESKRVFFENLEKNQSLNLNDSQPKTTDLNSSSSHFKADFTWQENWSEALKNQVQVTVANIIDGVLIDLKDEFKKMKSSHFIFTGILLEREKEFLEQMMSGWDIKILERVQKGEWVGFLFEARQ